MTTRRVIYATQSAFKQAELKIFEQQGLLKGGRAVVNEFRFDVRSVEVKEVLEVDLETMVGAEARGAYRLLREPCIVEHAGLIFEHRLDKRYPGGLTKPMWNALGDEFVSETQSAGRRAIARAVIGYCDGTCVRTFVGETAGVIATAPRGANKFYWDTVFQPDSLDPRVNGKTYAEIVDDPELGLDYKVLSLSQSIKALSDFLEFRLTNEPPLWMSRYAE